jgi:hypothetical protein
MRAKIAILGALLVFVAGLGVYVKSSEKPNPEAFVKSPFRITYHRYRQSDLSKRDTIIEVVNSRGAVLGRRFRDGREIQNVTDQYDQAFWNAWAGDREGYLRSPHVIRTEQIVGLTAYVFRQDIGNGQTVETWRAPETGPIFLKQIVESAGGDTLVTEAVSLEFREVSDAELVPQPNLIAH